MDRALTAALEAHQAGEWDQAVKLYRECLQAQPHQIDALHYLGVLLLQQGQAQAGIQLLEQALQQAPEQSEIVFNLINAYCQLKQWPEALKQLENWTAQSTTAADPEQLNQRAIIYFEMQQTLAALDNWRQAIAQAPEHVPFRFNLARALLTQGTSAASDEAELHLQTALRLQPDYAQAWNLLGNIYLNHGQAEAAEQAYLQALSRQSDWLEPLNNLATACWEQGQTQSAYEILDRLLGLQPGHAAARFNRGQLALSLGQLQQGFTDYEQARWIFQPAVRPLGNLDDRPLWQGEKLTSLLLVCEQGFGDSLQFIRYLVWVQSRVSLVYLECPAELYALFEALPDITLILEGQTLPETEAWCPLLRLPYLHNTRLETIPVETPYLKRPPRREAFEDALQALAPLRPRIGVVWATGNRPDPQMQKLYRRKSLKATDFEALASHWPEFDFYSLQVGPDAEILPAFKTLGAEIQDFADTAAYIQAMDLIISADTAVAHLAGALGQPVYLLLPALSDWRWLLNRSDSPWYPTMTLIRQTIAGDWESVIEKLGTELKQFPKRIKKIV